MELLERLLVAGNCTHEFESTNKQQSSQPMMTMLHALLTEYSKTMCVQENEVVASESNEEAVDAVNDIVVCDDTSDSGSSQVG